jgi:hypothetical protein
LIAAERDSEKMLKLCKEFYEIILVEKRQELKEPSTAHLTVTAS